MRAAKNLVIGTALEQPLRRLIRTVRPSALTGYDAQTVEVARRVLTHDSNVVDVGAHNGTLLEQFVGLAPDGIHVAVEPLPRHAMSLRRRFPGVAVHEVALADTPGTARFRHVVGSPEESSLDGHGHPVDADTDFFDVKVTTLDAVAPDRVALLKVDVEGAELRVFRGADRVLSQQPFVVFELSGHDAEVFDLMRSYSLNVNLMRRWLDGLPPLSQDAFFRATRDAKEFVFLAHQ